LEDFQKEKEQKTNEKFECDDVGFQKVLTGVYAG
tara:strand:+ start:1111 stop:1212 length:102 start_codon:yes stop_codon:yes gene_type:complete